MVVGTLFIWEMGFGFLIILIDPRGLQGTMSQRSRYKRRLKIVGFLFMDFKGKFIIKLWTRKSQE